MADEIRADYEKLQQVASRFSANANAAHHTHQRVQRAMNQLQPAWIGQGSQAFFAEMTTEVLPTLKRLTDALSRGQAVTEQIIRIFQAAEEDAARPFRSEGAEGNRLLRPFLDLLKGAAGILDTAWDVLPIPAALLLASGLRLGTAYSGEVILRAPQLLKDLGISGRWLRDVAGVSSHLNHIKSINIATHIGAVTRSMIAVDALISAGKGVIAVADVWEAHSGEYAGYDGTRRASAMAVDGGLTLLPVVTEFGGGVGGVLVGAKAGMVIGATIGTVVPVVGNAVGAVAGGLIGSAIGGFAGDWLGGKVGEAGAGWLQDNVGRQQMINYVDEQIAQPVTDAVTDAAQAVGSWFSPPVMPTPVSTL